MTQCFWVRKKTMFYYSKLINKLCEIKFRSVRNRQWKKRRLFYLAEKTHSEQTLRWNTCYISYLLNSSWSPNLQALSSEENCEKWNNNDRRRQVISPGWKSQSESMYLVCCYENKYRHLWLVNIRSLHTVALFGRIGPVWSCLYSYSGKVNTKSFPMVYNILGQISIILHLTLAFITSF